MPMRTLLLLASAALVCTSLQARAQQAPAAAPASMPRPWMNTALSADARADLLLRQLTLDQKIQLLHGTGDPHDGPEDPHAKDGNSGSGYVPGFPEYGLPGIQMDDSAYGVAYSAGSGRYSTALPSNLGLAATWDPAVAERYGSLIGHELRDQGYNMTLGGGVNLTREPRDGRTFEYLGEDPVLAGTMVGHLIQGVQSAHVIGHIKHYAVNDQESGRHAVSSEISERAARESDLLAFQLGIEIGRPGAVMCSYNRINGVYGCENDFLLKTVLKGDWHYPGFVVSDWLATHSTVHASHAGLDNEEPGNTFFDTKLKAAVTEGSVSTAELDDHVHRVLRSMFAAGIVDDPPQKGVPDVFAHALVAREIAQQSMVLLRNEAHTLPIDTHEVHTLAVIGRNADRGMISGGGSAQVDPPGGNAIGKIDEKDKKADWQRAVWFPDSPLAAIQEHLRSLHESTRVTFNDGSDLAAAAEAARHADVVLVYAYQWQAEGIDLPTLALPDAQDAMIAAVAHANPHTVVVLETGGPVLMQWVHDVAAIVESWYSGSKGADAVADLLFGTVNPGSKLPVTFPLRDQDLPHPALIEPPPASQEDWTDTDRMSRRLLAGLPPFSVRYDEALKVGYKWYDAEKKPVLFPFGFGLSYTTFAYSNLRVEEGSEVTATFTIRNTGARAGEEIAELYSTMPETSGEPPKRLVGWCKLLLQPGEQKTTTVSIPLARFSIWDEAHHGWSVPPGKYALLVGPSSATAALQQTLNLKAEPTGLTPTH
ncbi:glycoside hydrolase family 3 C-terminal domain-containing protein [Acidipila sp. EB88]|uniref:beta-glucosidase n=1 Tax=Acidipila sp. EB88 TaxID=2305226 RepID=UPI000F5E89FF|nr:glycoside hydrolase family 3 C-terminal domain-containing protein [Acidipila sp. EB88]RRA49546.1 glycosyl hydrolase [Acidipila sp. EB88]